MVCIRDHEPNITQNSVQKVYIYRITRMSSTVRTKFNSQIKQKFLTFCTHQGFIWQKRGQCKRKCNSTMIQLLSVGYGQ